MKTLSKLLFFIAWCLPFSARADWMDRSHTIFLPHEIRDSLGLQMEFPNTWWNFAIVEPVNGEPDFARAQAVCHKVASITGTLLKKTACPDIKSFQPLLKDWSADISKRTTAPTPTQIQAALDSARAKASLPMDRELLEILRADPLETYHDLKNLMMKNMKMGLSQEKGFFVDPATKKIAIPLQYGFSPQETAQSKLVRANVEKAGDVVLVGPHMSAAENESQIMSDVDIISIIGTIIMILQLGFVVYTRRYKYFWLIPPVVVGVGGAIALTVVIFGSIHGLTLSLGTGIIGLALDFGLHSAHNINWKGVWRANLFGLLTTFAGLLAIALSGIPLLRQMMVFASLGLVLSYTVYYFMHSRFPDRFHVEPFNYQPRPHILKTTIALGLVAMSFIGITFIRPNLNMNQFDFQSAETKENLFWLYGLINKQMPLFSVRERTENMFAEAEKQNAWAKEHGIALTNFAQFLPNPEVQTANAETWQGLCQSLVPSDDDKLLFKPFLSTLPCNGISVHTFDSAAPAYLTDVMSAGNWLTIWLPRSPDEVRAIKDYDTKSYSLGEVVQLFPKTLGQELIWMLPLSIGLCLLLLVWYFRRLGASLVSLVPFLSGVGMYFTCVVVLGWSFSFISIISLIMVFGFSIDYGIFAANLYILKDPPNSRGVWTCLVFAAFVTLLGFLPLVLCHHPVLIHLGQTLVAGTVGTLIGTVWGVPGIFALGWLDKEVV